MLEPTEALESTENALRLVVRLLLGDSWQTKVTPERLAQFNARMAEEAKRRDGVSTSTDLLAFTDFTDLTRLVLKEWDTFKPVFDDQARMKMYFSLFEDVRNSIAHSRHLVEYERELLSGMTKHIRNQVALYRMGDNPASKYYPVIESVVDSLGNVGLSYARHLRGETRTNVRLNIGDTVSFTCYASDPIGRDLHWILQVGDRVEAGYSPGRNDEDGGVIGNDVEMGFVVQEEDFGEKLSVSVFMHNSSKYRRGEPPYPTLVMHGFDDSCHFTYAVNPPIYFSK